MRYETEVEYVFSWGFRGKQMGTAWEQSFTYYSRFDVRDADLHCFFSSQEEEKGHVMVFTNRSEV